MKTHKYSGHKVLQYKFVDGQLKTDEVGYVDNNGKVYKYKFDFNESPSFKKEHLGFVDNDGNAYNYKFVLEDSKNILKQEKIGYVDKIKKKFPF